MSESNRGPRRRLVDRLGSLLVSGLTALPERAQIFLSGGAPIVRDGHPLAPDVQLILAGEARRGGGQMNLSDPHALRVEQRNATALAGGRPVKVGSVRDLQIDGGAGRLRARHYAPALGEGAPLLVFLHGGGFVFGDLDTHDAPCRILCRHGGMHVLAIDYRLAPENPFPAALEDARAALRWAQAHAAELGADPTRIGVGGDSAGANLSAVVAQLASTDGGPAPICQVLIYPAVDRTRHYPSLELFDEGFLLTGASIQWFHERYVGDSGVPKHDPRIGPLHAPSLAGLPPALVITAGFDPLRDEGEAYAAAMSAAGSTAVVRRFDSLVHGFFNLVGISPTSRDAVIEIAGATRTLFAIASSGARRAPVPHARPQGSGVVPS
ncbi:MAG TPA: alpha/beta hydrolase [Labilithrix sp.]|nr:alpha/beta hydrolase [Labilithrix sp.]